ncbi:MAG: Sec-independent protein translocase protein TatB [Pseudomonadota bacterium]
MRPGGVATPGKVCHSPAARGLALCRPNSPVFFGQSARRFMFDLAWSELLVIGVVALLVIKPKDLPKVLRTVGYWVRHARQVASEFQSSLEQMAREAELSDVKKRSRMPAAS